MLEGLSESFLRLSATPARASLNNSRRERVLFARLSTHACIFVFRAYTNTETSCRTFQSWTSEMLSSKETLISTRNEVFVLMHAATAALLKQPTAVSLQIWVRGISDHLFIKEQRDTRVQHIQMKSDIADSFCYFKMPYHPFQSRLLTPCCTLKVIMIKSSLAMHKRILIKQTSVHAFPP